MQPRTLSFLLVFLAMGCGSGGFGGGLNGGGLFGGEFCAPFPNVGVHASPPASPPASAHAKEAKTAKPVTSKEPACADTAALRVRLEALMRRGYFDRVLRLVRRESERRCPGASEFQDVVVAADTALRSQPSNPDIAIRDGLSALAARQYGKARMLFDAALVTLERQGGAPRVIEGQSDYGKVNAPPNPTGEIPEDHRAVIELMRFSTDGRYLVLAGANRFQALFDFQSQAAPIVGGLEPGQYTNNKVLAISPDGKLVAQRDDTAVMLYSTTDGKFVQSLFGHEKNSDYSEAADSASFFRDNRGIATGDEKGTLRIFHTKIENALAETRALRDDLQALATSPDGRFVATAFRNESAIRIRALSGGATYGILPTETDEITNLEWSAEGRYIAASSLFGAIDIWDISTCKKLTIRDKPPCHRYEDGSCGYAAMFGMAISDDGAYVASSFDEIGFFLWDAHSGKRLAAVPLKVDDKAWSVAFSADGELFATGSVHGASLFRIKKTGAKELLEPLVWISLLTNKDTDGYALDGGPTSHYDVYGAGSERLACLIGKTSVPLVVCEDRLRVPGLVGLRARGLAADPLDVDREP